MKKYLVVGGMVRSRNDGQMHYVSPKRLVNLYGVDPAECVLTSEERYFYDVYLQGHPDWRELTVLGPRNDGKYELNQ